MDIDKKDRIRDANLRMRLLQMLENARKNPLGVRGRKLMEWMSAANGPDQFEDDGHLESLLMDLQNEKYITLDDIRVEMHEVWGLDKIDCRISAKGTRFLAGGEPTDPLINDGRIQNRRG